MNKPDGLQAFEQPLASLPCTLRQLILERIQNLTHYEPVIGIMGKVVQVNPLSATNFSGARCPR